MSHLDVDAVVDLVVDLLGQRIGLRADLTLRGRLTRAVTDAAAAAGGDLGGYADALSEGGPVFQDLLNRVTVQETAFFRHPRHFEVLVQDVLPNLVAPVRIWSAGCANGQEAYSLAMVLAELGIDGHVIATDLSTTAVERTQAGRYTDREISGLSPLRLRTHMRYTGEDWEVCSSLRDRVRVLHHNLLDPLPVEVALCQVVFCRNVLIYFSAKPIRLFLDRLANTLPSAAVLFLGASETLWQVTDRFTAVPARDTFIYRRTSPTVSETPRKTPSQPEPRRPESAHRPAVVRRPAAHTSTPEPQTAVDAADQLDTVGQEAAASGDFRAAAAAFRGCTRLRPYDPVAQLHLGLALEAIGDSRAAGRAFAAARAALLRQGTPSEQAGIEGYALTELLRLLDDKEGVTRSW